MLLVVSTKIGVLVVCVNATVKAFKLFKQSHVLVLNIA